MRRLAFVLAVAVLAGWPAMAGEDRPGLGEKLDGVHPGYRVVPARPEGMLMPVGGLGMLPDGRLVVARFDARTLVAPRPTEEPNGELWLLSNTATGDRADIQAELIAEGLFEPQGVCVIDGVIYVSQREEVSRFVYNERGGFWDQDAVASGWETNDFHHFCAGLLHEPGPTGEHPGYLYLARSSGLGLWQNPPNHGSVWRIDLSKPAGENVTPITGGHRAPNGIGFGPDGQVFVVENQGEWNPANELNHVQEGHFYGFYQRDNPPRAYPSPFQPDDPDNPDTPPTQAAIKLPQSEIGNSPTQPLLFPAGHAFAGQLVMGDMHYGGLNRIYLEEVNGVWQGCAMRMTQGLEGGPNRLLWGPEGSLYVGSIGGSHHQTWWWSNPAREPTYQGLERLVPTGEDAFEVFSMSATADGFVLAFTRPVPAAFLALPENFELHQWTYRATRGYGGPKLDEQSLRVERAVVADDRRSVRLVVPGLKPGYVVHLRTDPVDDAGTPIWSGDVWYTLNEVPGE